MRVVLATVMVCLAACGERAPTPSPAPVPSEPAPRAEHTPAVAPAPIAIGWETLPHDPDRDARAANAAALRVHARGDHEASLAAFEAIAREHPDYLAARFNAACAHARLGHVDEAVSILRALLALDLPSFGPRLDADEDLAMLRASAAFASLAAHRDAVHARYAAALREGAPVVHPTALEVIPSSDPEADAIERRTFQSGVWLHRERRFVPMAPRIVREVERERAGLALTAMAIDRERDAVLVLEGMGTWSEGGGPLAEARVIAYEAGTGAMRAQLASRAGSPAWCPPIEAHATSTGLAVRFGAETLEGWVDPQTRRVGESGYDADVRPSLEASLVRASVRWPAGSAPEGMVLERDALRLGQEVAPLPREHLARGRRVTRHATWAPRDATSAWLLTAALEYVEWGSMRAGPVALSVVTIDRGRPDVRLVASERAGVGAMVVAGDGTVYAQLGERVVRLAIDGDPEPLPSGLVILSSPPGTY